jgi:hypothetical protein
VTPAARNSAFKALTRSWVVLTAGGASAKYRRAPPPADAAVEADRGCYFAIENSTALLTA